MLDFGHRRASFSRRSFLRVGSLGLGGLSLLDLLAARKAGGAEPLVRDRSVIFVFLHGGPSQFETFDPKMTAPPGIRSTTGEIATSVPGLTFGGTFPRLAQLAHQFSIVRSFQTGDGNHDIKPIVSRFSSNANLGSVIARVSGSTDVRTGMPRNQVLLPQAVDSTTQPGVKDFGRFDSTGMLGSALQPFVPGVDGDLQRDMRIAMELSRLDDRRQLLGQIDQLKQFLDTNQADSVDKLRQQAYDTIIGGLSKAFDLSLEDSSVVERYDTAPLVRPDQISRKWNNYNNYVDNAKTLGKLCLLARRLCEQGAGFVTVTTNFVWDMHADVNNAGCAEGMQYMGRPLDYALSALIEDIEQRGLYDKIMVVVCGEMGRTPQVNNQGGRDHWGNLAPLLVYGGGVQRGHVIGQSNRDGSAPQSEPVGLDQLIATIVHSLLDVGQVRLLPGLPADVQRVLTSGKPIDGLLS